MNNELVLTGLDASNPLGFLAALGVLEALSDRERGWALSFVALDAWRPRLTRRDDKAGAVELEHVLDAIDADLLACGESLALALEYDGKRDLKPPPAVFRAKAAEIQGVTTAAARRDADWLASFGDELVTDESGESLKPSALHFTAGTQYWLQMANIIRASCGREDLRRALIGPWTNRCATPVLRWDSTSTRDFALLARNPSDDPQLGEFGAEWLALRGWTSLQVTGIHGRLRTTCCAGSWKRGGSFRWPLWSAGLPRDVVRTVLRHEWAEAKAGERAARGIELVFSSDITRAETGGRGSFSAAKVI